MTAPPDVEQPSALTLPPSGSGERAARRRHQSRRRVRTALFAVAMVLLVVAIPVLAAIGVRTLRDTTTGRRIGAQNDPSKPRYEANVVPTPVALVVETDDQGALAGVTMVTLGRDDSGGSVIFIPSATVAPLSTGGQDTLDHVASVGHVPALQQAAANLLGLSFGEVLVVSPSQWQQFVTPVGPVTFDNPDRLVQLDAKGRTSVLFPAGTITLAPEQVATYLHARNPNESDAARLVRNETFWTAWLAAIKASHNPNAVPGELTSGFGRYARGLAKGNVDLALLPVKPTGSGTSETFQPDKAAVADLVSREVPLPTPANPGDRVRVRVLSGAGPIGSPNAVASKVVSVGGEVIIVGNADRFDYATTQIEYYDDAFAAAANKIQAALGIGTVIKSSTPTDIEDVTIVLGRDAAGPFPGSIGGSGG